MPSLVRGLIKTIIEHMLNVEKERDDRIRHTVAAVTALGAFDDLESRKDLITAVELLFEDPDAVTGGVTTPTYMHALQLLENLALKSFDSNLAQDLEDYIVCIS